MTEGLPQVARVEPGEVTPALVTALYTGAVVSRVEAGVVLLTGPGAVTSFQGLLTNDVELPGDGSFVYGALLTPKGMIVVDGWAARLGATVSYTVPADGGGPERALAIFTRSVPPRLARVSDRAGFRGSAVRRPGDDPPSGGRAARRALAGRRRGRGRSRRTRAEPYPGRLAPSRRRNGREDHPPGSALRRDRWRVVYQGLLHRPGDGRAAAFPRSCEPTSPRLAVRSGATRHPRRRLE